MDDKIKDSLLAELYKLSSGLDWAMFPKSMKKDFTKKEVLIWCLTSKVFRRAQKTEIFENFSARVSRMADLLKSKEYQEQTKRREIAELESLRRNGDHIKPEAKQYTAEEIEKRRLNITVNYPCFKTLKDQLEALQKIYLANPDATIEKDYDYEVIVIGKESFSVAEARLNKNAKEIYDHSVAQHTRYKFLCAKYLE